MSILKGDPNHELQSLRDTKAMSQPSHDATSNEDLTDAEMVQRVRRWLSSTKERDIDWRWLLRTCTIAEKALQASPSVIGLEPKEGHCLLQVPQQTKEKPSPCAMAGHCLSAESILSAMASPPPGMLWVDEVLFKTILDQLTADQHRAIAMAEGQRMFKGAMHGATLNEDGSVTPARPA